MAPEAQGAPPAESAPAPAAEAVTEPTTENGDATTPEAPAPRSIDDLSDDELVEHPRFRGELRKREESQRQKAEADTARRLNQQAQTFVNKGGVRDAMVALVNQGIDKGNFDQNHLQSVANSLWVATTTVNNAAFEAAIDSAAPLEGVSQKTKDSIERIRNGIETGRHTMEDLIAARLDAHKEAVIAAEMPRLRKEIEADIRKTNAAATETSALRQNGEQRSSQARPSSLSGSASGGRDASSIIADSSASPAERRRAFEEKHGFAPA